MAHAEHAEVKTDSLQRRLRYAKPQPKDKRIELHDGDIAIFDAIHRHGPLPTHYLHRFTGAHPNSVQHRLTKLYNGTPSEKYLVRPPQQFASFHARYQPLVYDLHWRAEQILSEQGKLSPYIRRTDPFLHRLMGACVMASIELACRVKGLRFIPRHEILEREGNPIALPLSPSAPRKTLVPDELFGIDYGGAYRFFAVEIDRNTESLERRKIGQNTFGRKLQCYVDAMKHRRYKEHWGIPNLMVITVTVNHTHMQGMMDYMKKLDSHLAERFLFKTLPHFGSNWRIPPVMEDMLEPWQRPVGTDFAIDRK